MKTLSDKEVKTYSIKQVDILDSSRWLVMKHSKNSSNTPLYFETEEKARKFIEGKK